MLLKRFNVRLVMINIIRFCMRNLEPVPRLSIPLPCRVSGGGVLTLAIRRYYTRTGG